MTRKNLSLLRVSLGFATGLVLWLIFQLASSTTPELESIKFRYFIDELLSGPTGLSPANAASDGFTTVSNWRGLFPLACLFGVLFSIMKPLPRFITWISANFVTTLVAIYCFHVFKYIVPFGGPLIVLNCFYLCGTLIYLETEKIERNRNFAIDLQIQAEGERKRIAKDLHDESLQSLSKVVRLVDKLQEGASDSAITQDIRNRLESCISGMRGVIDDLHPAALEEFGLAVSIESIVDDFQRTSGLKTKFGDKSGAERLPSFHELCIFRIAQETLNNIEKHAEASQIDVKIEKSDHHWILRIADDGNGAIRRKRDSHGLRNIEERANLLGAKVEWKKPAEFSSGTMLVLSVPLPASKAFSNDAAKMIADAKKIE